MEWSYINFMQLVEYFFENPLPDPCVAEHLITFAIRLDLISKVKKYPMTVRITLE